MNVLVIADFDSKRWTLDEQVLHARSVYGEYASIYFSNVSRTQVPIGAYFWNDMDIDHVIVFGEIISDYEWHEIINAQSVVILTEIHRDIDFDIISVHNTRGNVTYYTEEQFRYALTKELKQPYTVSKISLYKMKAKETQTRKDSIRIDNATGVVYESGSQLYFDNLSVFREVPTTSGTIASIITQVDDTKENEHTRSLYNFYGVIIPRGAVIKTMALLPSSILNKIDSDALFEIYDLLIHELDNQIEFDIEASHSENCLQSLESLYALAKHYDYEDLYSIVDVIITLVEEMCEEQYERGAEFYRISIRQ